MAEIPRQIPLEVAKAIPPIDTKNIQVVVPGVKKFEIPKKPKDNVHKSTHATDEKLITDDDPNAEKFLLEAKSRYVYNNSSMGSTFKIIEEDHNLERVGKQMRKTGKKDIEELKKAGAIEETIEDGVPVIKTHIEKLGELFPQTPAAVILKSIKKNPELSMSQISKKAKKSYPTIWFIINALCEAGLLDNKSDLIKDKGKDKDKDIKEIREIRRKPTKKEHDERIGEIDKQIAEQLSETSELDQKAFLIKMKDTHDLGLVKRRINVLCSGIVPDLRLIRYVKVKERKNVTFLRQVN